MIGIIRIYAELSSDVPEHLWPHKSEMFKVIDCAPHLVPEIRRRLKRQGYDIICVPL
jgi:hypothetical protein